MYVKYRSLLTPPSKPKTHCTPTIGYLSSNRFRNWRRSSRRCFPCQVLQQGLRICCHLSFQPNVGQPQPNLRKRPPPNRHISILRSQVSRTELQWPDIDHHFGTITLGDPPPRLCTQPNGCRPNTRTMEEDCRGDEGAKAVPLLRLRISRIRIR